MRNLANRTALVTGASRGIGIHIVRALIEEQMNVVLSGLSEAELHQAKEIFSKRGAKVSCAVTDLADASAIESLVNTASREFGAIDVLVNNAGIEMFFSYHKLQCRDIERIIRVNLIGAMLLTRLVLPGMLERGLGHVVNMSSLSGKGGPPCSEPYVATKAGLIAFTESLRAEYCGSGVGFSVICPGFVEAGIYQRVVEETGQRAPRLIGTSSPETVAQAVIRAIKNNIAEIIINPGPTRLLTTLGELSPALGEWIMRRLGVVEWFKNVAQTREQRQKLSTEFVDKSL
jgi:short-subunit dehydrogenase